MSYQLMAWAAEQKTGSPTRKAVLLALANAANHHSGRCHPSIDRICAETEFGRTAVKDALADLSRDGLVHRERRRRADGSLGTYEYTFPHVNPADDIEPRRGQPGTPDDPRPGPRGDPQNQEVLNQEENLLPTASARPRNPIWDALTTIFGEAETRTAQTLRGRVCRSLAEARASPDEIVRRARLWPHHFDGATLTETALEKHWTTLGRKPLRRQQ